MDSVFGSPKINRQILRKNGGTLKQTFEFNPVRGKGAEEFSSVYSWASPGRGVQGESVNSQNNASKQVIKKSWRAS